MVAHSLLLYYVLFAAGSSLGQWVVSAEKCNPVEMVWMPGRCSSAAFRAYGDAESLGIVALFLPGFGGSVPVGVCDIAVETGKVECS